LTVIAKVFGECDGKYNVDREKRQKKKKVKQKNKKKKRKRKNKVENRRILF